jgi:hypothetical protein
MTQLIKSRLKVVKLGLGLDRTLLVRLRPMHRKALIDHVIPVLGAGNILQNWRTIATRCLHLGPVREHLDVTVHVGRELIKRAQTTQYILVVTLARPRDASNLFQGSTCTIRTP